MLKPESRSKQQDLASCRRSSSLQKISRNKLHFSLKFILIAHWLRLHRCGLLCWSSKHRLFISVCRNPNGHLDFCRSETSCWLISKRIIKLGTVKQEIGLSVTIRSTQISLNTISSSVSQNIYHLSHLFSAISQIVLVVVRSWGIILVAIRKESGTPIFNTAKLITAIESPAIIPTIYPRQHFISHLPLN